MLSYQHAYHAGGPADVHKHLVLAELLTLLTGKDRGISYLETHAGRGLYDLSSEETAKTGEAAEGIALLSPHPSSPFGRALASARARGGPSAYPGSPLVAEALLRPQDRLVLMEAHPQEHVALKNTMRGTIAEVHRRDGYEGSLALAPLQPRRGLVLVDPSYEDKTEYERAGDHALALRRKWPEASVLIWYPLLKAGRHETLLSVLEGDDPLVSEVAFDLKEGRGMTGSGLLLLNAPYGGDAALKRALAQGAPVLRPVG
jgi:23S rRNA (adenine2030-N6)-methyltransferase